MILDADFFIGDLYLPEATPTAGDNNSSIGNSLNNFIEKYEDKCLTEVLGETLYTELKENLSQESGFRTTIKIGADDKWDNLYNGETITLSDGSIKRWRGIVYKISDTSLYRYSFITNYVYYYYEMDSNIVRTRLGNVKPKGKNADVISPANKSSKAWNEFVDVVQGLKEQVYFGRSNWGLYTDYSQNSENSILFNLKQYIDYKNNLDKTTYEHFSIKRFERINEFGI